MGETNLRYTPMTPMKIRRGRIYDPPSGSPTLLLLNLRKARINSSFNSSKEASAALGRAEITKSKSSGSPTEEERKISLSFRRTPLRFTAVPTFLETERPNLDLPIEFGKT